MVGDLVRRHARCELHDLRKVSAVLEQQPAFLRHLDKLHIHMGTPLKVNEHVEFDKSMSVTVNNSLTANISHEVAKNILIAK